MKITYKNILPLLLTATLVTACSSGGIGTPPPEVTSFEIMDPTPSANDNFVVVSYMDDEDSIVDVGTIRLVDGNTGIQNGTTVTGSASLDFDSSNIVLSANGLYYVLGAPFPDSGGMVDSSLVRVIVP